MIDIPDAILEQTKFIASFADDVDDWVTIKKLIMNSVHSTLRKNFSRRDHKTKNQYLNDFEKQLIIYYKELTGIELVLRTLDERREMFDVL
jgi:hypothetical protein|tara:strand:- start:101 stop:373 length:273 start_codon:yes stop_codon:yes gene_type:complete